MGQEVYGARISSAFSNLGTRLIVINSSDLYVWGLASLLKLHWFLPGYQPGYAAPGGSLVFELRQSRTSGEYLVRVFYTSQTFDQLRNLAPLALDPHPATQQLLIPGGGLDIRFDKFTEILGKAFDFKDVQDPATETPPAPLTGVPLQ
jgi:4-phytase/acid phosphatase